MKGDENVAVSASQWIHFTQVSKLLEHGIYPIRGASVVINGDETVRDYDEGGCEEPVSVTL
jgi:hypothetical protein